MIKTIISDKNENSKKVFTAYNKNYVAMWTSQEYRFDTELVKYDKNCVVFKTRLGYEGYKLVPTANGITSEPFDYKEILTDKEVENFDKYYEKMYGKTEHPEIDLTPEEFYKLLKLKNRTDGYEEIIDKIILNEKRREEEFADLKNQNQTEVEKILQEREQEKEKIQQIEETAKSVINDLTQKNLILLNRLKEKDKIIDEFNAQADNIEKIKAWYIENEKAILSKSHLRLLKIAIFLMIMNIIIAVLIL